uniref:Uncharacterized protein n=1 Tax=Anopheles maculatus TaxID=74869 RepID=A0A182STR6_9DIPT
DGTVVEHDEEISIPPEPAETDAPNNVSNDKLDGDGDDHTQETLQPELERGVVEGISETNDELLALEPNGTDSVEAKENGHMDAPEDEHLARRSSSAREATVGSAKSNEIDRTSDTEAEQEANPSPVALEEAEVSKDSLEQVQAKDDEIEQDSLGKDLEPEELVTGGDREPSAASDKRSVRNSDSQSGSRATTGKSIKSIIAVEEQSGVEEHISRNSSAAVVSNGLPPSNGMVGNSEPEDTPDINNQENREELVSARSGRHRTYPNSAKESLTSTSRPPSGTDVPLESVSRVASSTLTTTHTSGKSSHSSTRNRKASIGSRKSVTSTASSATRAKTVKQDGDQDGEGDDSEANDDSNNADVQIASYRTPDEV